MAFVVYSDWSPQTKIANKYKIVLGQGSTLADWDRVMMDLMTAIRSSEDMDPLLQVALLKKVADNAIEGSEPLRAALGPSKELLEQGDVDARVPWMDPDNADAERLRPQALELVKSLPDLAEVLREAHRHHERLEQVVKEFPRSVGWLAKRRTAGSSKGKATPQRRGPPGGCSRDQLTQRLEAGRHHQRRSNQDSHRVGRCHGRRGPVFAMLRSIPKS